MFSKDFIFSNCWTNLLDSNPNLDIPVSTLRCKENLEPNCLPILLQIKHSLKLLIVGIRLFLKDIIKSFFVYRFPRIRIGFLTPKERSLIPSFKVATPNCEAPPLIAYSETTFASCQYPSSLTTAIN